MKASVRDNPLVGSNKAESLRSGRLMAKAWAESVKPNHRVGLARAFVTALGTGWWERMVAEGGRPSPVRQHLAPVPAMPSLPATARALADSLAEGVEQLEVAAAAHFIGETYTAMLPPAHRSQFGVFYTPPALAERLIDLAQSAGVDWTSARILDPACGGGAFLAPVARRVMASLDTCEPRIILNNIAARLRGYEIDPLAAWLSQVTLDAVMLPITRLCQRRLPVLVTVCDSLKRSPPKDRFDLVIGNPPYGRVSLVAEEREAFKRSLFGHANLYGLFTDLALRHATPNGVVAYLTPTSFLAGEYFKNLRALLAHDAPPVSFDFVSSRRGVFDDVLQETLLTTYKRGAGGLSVRVSEVAVASPSRVDVTDTGTAWLPRDPSQPWLLPRSARQSALVRQLGTMRHRLADWGYGVSTGPLVWNRKKSQLAWRPGRNRLPLIWAEAVTADGAFVWRADKKNHAPYFEVHRQQGADQWLLTHKPCVLLQRTTAKEQHRRLIAAALPAAFLEQHGAVVIENHLNMIRPIVDTPAVDSTVLAAFLNSDAADRAFRCVSGSVAVSAYELESLPIPAPEEMMPLKVLLRTGADRSDVEAACAQLYDNDGLAS